MWPTKFFVNMTVIPTPIYPMHSDLDRHIVNHLFMKMQKNNSVSLRYHPPTVQTNKTHGQPKKWDDDAKAFVHHLRKNHHEQEWWEMMKKPYHYTGKGKSGKYFTTFLEYPDKQQPLKKLTNLHRRLKKDCDDVNEGTCIQEEPPLTNAENVVNELRKRMRKRKRKVRRMMRKACAPPAPVYSPPAYHPPEHPYIL